MSTWLRNHAVFNVELRMATEDTKTFRSSMKSQILHIKNLSRISCKSLSCELHCKCTSACTTSIQFLMCICKFLTNVWQWISFVTISSFLCIWMCSSVNCNEWDQPTLNDCVSEWQRLCAHENDCVWLKSCVFRPRTQSFCISTQSLPLTEHNHWMLVDQRWKSSTK